MSERPFSGVRALRERVAEAQQPIPFSLLRDEHVQAVRDVEVRHRYHPSCPESHGKIRHTWYIWMSPLIIKYFISIASKAKQQNGSRPSTAKATASRFLGQFCKVELEDGNWISATPNQVSDTSSQSLADICSQLSPGQQALCSKISSFLQASTVEGPVECCFYFLTQND